MQHKLPLRESDQNWTQATIPHTQEKVQVAKWNVHFPRLKLAKDEEIIDNQNLERAGRYNMCMNPM